MDPVIDPPAAPASAPAAVVPPVVPAVVPPVTGAPAVPAPIVPEKYELKAPEGYFDPKVVERVAEFAKANKMTQEAAQKYLESTTSEALKYGDVIKAAADNQQTEWKKAVATDKEIGGDNQVKSIELSKKVLTKFGNDEFIKFLEETRLGDNPELIRIFKRIGESMKEDDFITPGSQQGNSKKDAADTLYDNPSSSKPS